MEDFKDNSKLTPDVTNSDGDNEINPNIENYTDLIARTIDATTEEAFEQQLDVVGLVNRKKDLVRSVATDNLRDILYKEIETRLTTHPGQLSNSDLLKFVEALSSESDKNRKGAFNKPKIGEEEKPTVQTTIINSPSEAPVLNRDSQKNVMTAVSALLEQINAQKQTNVADAEITSMTPEQDDDVKLQTNTEGSDE